MTYQPDAQVLADIGEGYLYRQLIGEIGSGGLG